MEYFNVIESKIHAGSAEFEENLNIYSELLSEFHNITERVVSHGSEPAQQKHRERGKLLARERIKLLVDPGTSFLELSPLAAFGQYNDEFPSAGIVTGIGLINGRECMVVANDATVKGGTYIRETIRKHVRAQEIAETNNLPCIYLVDSGGIFLPEQARVFPDRFDFGRVFYNQARMSAKSIPQISVVMGSCTAGGAYIPAMSDETVMVRGQAAVYIGGPPLVKAATGEEVSSEELGGGDVHFNITGLADHLADDDAEAIRICREVAKSFKIHIKSRTINLLAEGPVYDPSEIYGLLPPENKKPVDSREIIARIIDGSRFHEVKSGFGTSLITGFARIFGMPVGIIANNSFLTPESSQKGAEFISLCNQRSVPLLFLQNITGFIVGKKYEHQGLIREGAKLIQAVATAKVPKITLVFGGSFGAGNYAMAGRAFDPDFLFMWPNSRISVMGGQQAKTVLETVGNRQADELSARFENESSAYYSTSRLWDDGIIDPAKTREILGLALSVVQNKTLV